MGRRSATETTAQVLVAFVDRSTWSQADLARRCGVSTRAVRKCLEELRAAHVPLEDEAEHPHVYWSVPEGWIRRSEVRGVDVAGIARLIARLPKTQMREQILQKLTSQAFGITLAPNASELRVDEGILAALEEGRAQRVAMRITYRSARVGRPESRCVSVQHIDYQGRPRFVAHCHKSRALRWFRVDRVERASAAADTAYVAVEASMVDSFVAESLDGFAGPRDSTLCEIELSAPVARWAIENMPAGARPQVRNTESGKVVRLYTSALEVLARFVVGLGADAKVIHPRELRQAVHDLAQAAARASAPN